MKSGIKLKGRVKSKIFDSGGKLLKETPWKYNTISNSAFTSVSGLIGNTGSKSAFTFLAVGTDNTAAAAAQSALIAEVTNTGLDRIAATVSQQTDSQTEDTLQLVHTWTATGSKTIEEIGVFDTSTSDTGTMLGRSLTESKSLSSGQMLQMIYQIIFS